MSTDNTIVILGTKRTFIKEGNVQTNHQPLHTVYRVAHIQAWDNYQWFKENQLYNLGWYLNECFGKSEVYLDRGDALSKARAIDVVQHYVEYGIVIEETDLFYPGEY